MKQNPPDPTKLAGAAYQAVAESTALAIQDATDELRNINTIEATAEGIATEEELETPPNGMPGVVVDVQAAADNRPFVAGPGRAPS